MKTVINAVAAVLAVAVISFMLWRTPPPAWTDAEITVLRSLWLESLPALPAAPGNAVADSPAAALFGQKLIFDTRMSANGSISCATCHQPERRFTDGLQKGQAIGTSKRNTPSIVGTAHSPWLYWDGRRDSQWSQALSPLEDSSEHATDRTRVVRLIAQDENYRATYESLFGALLELAKADEPAVNTVFANVGKSIAAFERTIMPTTSRFDRFVAAVADGDVEAQALLFTDDEKWGLRIFIGAGNCTQCHNGPLFTNNEFHNTGVISFSGEVPDKGRVVGIKQLLTNEFNCLGQYSDDANQQWAELIFARTGVELIGALRTPSLRNLEHTAPFMHKGQIATIAAVLRHYNETPDAMIGHNEAPPLVLSARELRQLESFLKTLAAPVARLPAMIGGD